MRMAGKYVIILIVVFLSSCAQVGRISGGPEDRVAPKPIEDKMVPLNATTNFTGNEITIPFDEYFNLANPLQNIQMVPPHAQVTASVKKKTLKLSWEGQLEPNTTYAIYLNKAVRDLTERNDSTMQVVFSTGDEIDTLSYTVAVMDAWTQEPIKEGVVTLYGEDSNLVSIATIADGIAKLQYLHQGTYDMIALVDQNGDLLPQSNERIGFSTSGKITVESVYFDSVPLRMFLPKSTKYGIRKLDYLAPCAFNMSFNAPPSHSLQNVYVNGSPVTMENLRTFKYDSLQFVADAPLTDQAEVILETKFGEIIFSDTSFYRLKPKEKDVRIKIKTENVNNILPIQNAEFSVNGMIQDVDTSKIHLFDIKDSVFISNYDFTFLGNRFELDGQRSNAIRITFDSNAVITNCGGSIKYEATANYIFSEDLGEVSINLTAYSEPILLEILSKDDVVRSIKYEQGGTELIPNLPPNEYHFRIIRDSNSNGRWDVGDYETLQQPEIIDLYSKPVKVRANWTVEVTLNPLK